MYNIKKITTSKTFFAFIGLLLCIGAVSSFSTVKKDLQTPNTRIFDFKNSPTWRDAKPAWRGLSSNIYRMVAIQNFDSMLLSRDHLIDFTFSFSVINPRNMAVIYNFTDPDNFDFLYIDTDKNWMGWGTVFQGQRLVSKDLQKKITEDDLLTLRSNGNSVDLFSNDNLLLSRRNINQQGRLGFLLEYTEPPKTMFAKISLTGTTTHGRHISYKYIPYNAFYLPISIASLYILLILLIFWIRAAWQIGTSLSNITPMDQLKNIWMAHRNRKDPTDIIFDALALIAGCVIFSHILQISGDLRLNHFKDIAIWQALGLSGAVYGLFYILARGYEKIFDVISAPSLFISGLFFLYFLALINALTLKLNDSLFLILCVIGMISPLIYRSRLNLKSLGPKRPKFSIPPLTAVNALMGLWFTFALIYFLEYNFDPYRYPYTDEANFWFPAAKNIIDSGLISAGLANYRSGVLHPFSVPYIAAIPSLLTGLPFIKSVFFMPLVILITLTAFLNRIKTEKWTFFFFLIALHATFTFNWIGHLLYRSLYGEGLSLLFFLMITYEIIQLSNKKNISSKTFLLLSLCIGLLGLSKSPGRYAILLFFPVLAGFFVTQRLEISKKIKALLPAILFVLTPLVLWSAFTNIYHIRFEGFEFNPFSRGLGLPNTTILSKGFGFLWTSYPEAFYFTFLSFIFIALTFRRKEWVISLAAIIYFCSVIYFYAYVTRFYDFKSMSRYILPPVLSVFFMGAVGFNRIIAMIRDLKTNRMLTTALLIGISAVVLIRIF